MVNKTQLNVIINFVLQALNIKQLNRVDPLAGMNQATMTSKKLDQVGINLIHLNILEKRRHLIKNCNLEANKILSNINQQNKKLIKRLLRLNLKPMRIFTS